MTAVIINEKWRVLIDEWNHKLEYLSGGGVIHVGARKGELSEPRWCLEGFYPNLQQCLRAVIRSEATLVLDCDLMSYITELDRITDRTKL